MAHKLIQRECRLRFLILVLVFLVLSAACTVAPTRAPAPVPPSTTAPTSTPASTPQSTPIPTLTVQTSMKPTPTSGTRPSDFSLTHHWQEGSVPPPYHYEYDVRIGPGEDGEVIFSPDYPGKDTPVWREPFAVDEDAWDKLYALLKSKQFFTRTWRPASRPLVGGSLASLDVVAQDKHYTVPSQLEPADGAEIREIYDAIRALVPQSLWDSLMARRQTYENEHARR